MPLMAQRQIELKELQPKDRSVGVDAIKNVLHNLK